MNDTSGDNLSNFWLLSHSHSLSLHKGSTTSTSLYNSQFQILSRQMWMFRPTTFIRPHAPGGRDKYIDFLSFGCFYFGEFLLKS